MMAKLSKHAARLRGLPRYAALLALASFVAASCGESSSGPEGPVVGIDIVTVPGGQAIANLHRGITVQLVAAPFNEQNQFVNSPVTFSSSNAAVATVSGTGLVTTIAGGTTTITASAGGQTATREISVQFAVASVALTPANPTIRREGTIQLTANLTGTDNQPALIGPHPTSTRAVTWTSSNTAIATVSSTGLVAGAAGGAEGTSTITATAEGVSGNTVVTVSGEPAIATVTVTPANPFRAEAAQLQMTATARAASGTVVPTTFTWSSSAATTASVSATGLVTFVSKGTGSTGQATATITATGDNPAGGTVSGTTTATTAGALVSGVATTVPDVAAATAYWYAFEIPSGTAEIDVKLAGGTGDADLYIFAPTVTPSAINPALNALAFNNSTCFGALSGNTESCVRQSPAAGTWRVAIFAWGGAGTVSGVQVTAKR